LRVMNGKISITPSTATIREIILNGLITRMQQAYQGRCLTIISGNLVRRITLTPGRGNAIKKSKQYDSHPE